MEFEVLSWVNGDIWPFACWQGKVIKNSDMIKAASGCPLKASGGVPSILIKYFIYRVESLSSQANAAWYIITRQYICDRNDS